MSGRSLCNTSTPVRLTSSWARPRHAVALRLAARPVGFASCNPRALTGGRKPLLGGRPFVQESLNGSRLGGVQQAGLARAKVAAALATPAPPPLAPSAPVVPPPTGKGTPTKAPAVTVQFEVPACQVPFGDSVILVGDAPELGAWDPQAGLALEWGAGHTWSTRVTLSAGEALNFKVVKALRGGAVEWEQGENRCVALPVLSPLLSSCGTLRVCCSFGDATSTLVQLVGDKAKLQAAVSAATGRATELCRRREELRERMVALEAHVDESDRRLHEVSQRVQQAVGKQQWVQVGHMQWRRVPAPAAALGATGAADKQAGEQAQQPARAPAAPAATGAPAANGGRLPQSGTASGAPPLGGFPLPQAAEQLVREVVELGGVAAAAAPAAQAEPAAAPGMDSAAAALAAAAAAFAVAGVAVGVGSGLERPVVPAKQTNGAIGEANGAAPSTVVEGSPKAPATPEATSKAALSVKTPAAAGKQNSKPTADSAGAAASAAAARPAEEKGAGVGAEEEPKLRPEFPGLVELDAEHGALTFRFQEAASVPSAAELAERFAAPQLPQAAAASLHRLSAQAASHSAPSAVNGNGAVNGKAALLSPARVVPVAAVKAVNGAAEAPQAGSPCTTAEHKKSTPAAKAVVMTPPVANGVAAGAQAAQAVLAARPQPAAAAAAAKLGAGLKEKNTRSAKGASLKALARKGSFPAVAIIASVSHGVDLIKKIFW